MCPLQMVVVSTLSWTIVMEVRVCEVGGGGGHKLSLLVFSLLGDLYQKINDQRGKLFPEEQACTKLLPV